MADEWGELLFAASYGGVLFDVMATDDDVSRILARHEYPFRDGAVLQDMGRVPRTTRAQIVFIPVLNQTDNHIARHLAFLKLLDEAHAQDRTPVLCHPIYGSFRALPEGITPSAEANSRDTILLQVEFVEAGLDAAAFTTTNDQSVGSGVAATEGAVTGTNDVLAAASGEGVVVGGEVLPGSDVVTDQELADILSLEPVTVQDTALTTVEGWENNESITARQVNLELNAITNEISEETLRLKVASDVRRYPTYLAFQRLHAAVRFSADLAIQSAPKLFELNVKRTESLLAIAIDVYGGRQALDRYTRSRELNDIDNPNRIPAGTTLTLEQP